LKYNADIANDECMGLANRSWPGLLAFAAAMAPLANHRYPENVG
jgi:hypothetical protein